MKIFLRNFPLPEEFIITLAGGGILQMIHPVSIVQHSIAGWVAGLILIILGLVLSGWALIVAGRIDLEKPTRLVTRGPYRVSRNPMYLAWGFIGVGFTLVINSLWLAIASILALLTLNFITIPKEEQSLFQMFTEEYDNYRNQVRRWL